MLVVGCMGDDEYSTSSTDKLSFSADTVSFDTIISGQPTNTYTFEVYNNNDKGLRLASVQLEKGSGSNFSVNVDGVFLENGAATDFEIAAHDSLRVFLMANVPATDTDEPTLSEDKLVFTTEGGSRQEVVLQAYSQDVYKLNGVTLSEDTTFLTGRPYVITDSLVVGEGATLHLTAGTRLYFHPGASLIVRGRLVAEGAQGNPVLMRGDRLGQMFSQQPYDRIPAQWGGVVFASESYGNTLNYCDIHSGMFGIRCDSSDVSTETLRLENSIVHNVSGDVLYARSSNVFVGNSQLTNAGGNCVTLLGGNGTFIHCTIANFYAFSGGRGVALYYANTDGDVRLPLESANFTNCLITGYSEDEVMAVQSDRYKDDAFNFSFSNCLLNTPKAEDERIVNCLWDDDDEMCREKHFLPEFDLDRLVFTFTLNPASKAVGAADVGISATYYPNDLNGVSRTGSEGSDIGCYQHVSEGNKQ